jgi:hypothetical protein
MQNFLNPGDAHPFNGQNGDVNQGMIKPPGLPGQGYTDMFMPSILRDPLVSGVNAGTQIGSFASQAVPAAGVFQSQLYNPNLNNMEQNFLGSSSDLGRMGLADAFNRIDSQYEGAPGNNARDMQYMDAGNQFAAQMMNTGMQAGLQRQQMATQNLGNAFQAPLQANQFAQESASNLNNLAQNAMYGDMQYPTSVWQSAPMITPTLVQGAASSGKGK